MRANCKAPATVFVISLIAAAIAAGPARAQDLEADNRTRQPKKIAVTSDNSHTRGDRFRVYRGDRYYETNGWGAETLRMAITEGYRQGSAQGRSDSEDQKRSNWAASDIYKRAEYGYQQGVDRGEYKYYFRQGFQRGYLDGYSGRCDYGYAVGGKLQVMVSVVNKLMTVVAW